IVPAVAVGVRVGVEGVLEQEGGRHGSGFKGVEARAEREPAGAASPGGFAWALQHGRSAWMGHGATPGFEGPGDSLACGSRTGSRLILTRSRTLRKDIQAESARDGERRER